ncbi:MAG: TrbI/VirB10 family protein, partial [Alphaproteobacteria bacterium]|nr:TrbI/VirB10 family protein [Alphaproteobacteria bacterium]
AWPNTYTRFARVALVWDRLVRPDGAEFIFAGDKPISGDAQGKLGVPGKGSTDYLEQFVKPMITSIVPAAINLISPTAEIFTRKLLTDSDGDLNILETGESTSKEKAKQEMIATWNKIAHKLVDDTLENTTPPFVVPAGTRITIYPKTDIMLRFVDDDSLFNVGDYRDKLVDDADGIGSVKELGPTNSAEEAVGNIKDVVSDMGAAQAIRDQEEAARAAAWAEATKQQDFSVANNDPLAVFDEEVAVGKLADGTEVYQDADGYYYGYDSSDMDFDVDEKDVQFYD